MSNRPAREGLTMQELVELTGVKRTTLNYWKKQGVFDATEASKNNMKKHGRRYDLKNVQIVLTAARMREEGIPFRRIRKACEALQEYGEDLASAVLYTDEEGIYRVDDENDVLTKLSDRSGQLVFRELVALYEVAKKAREEYEKRTAA